LDNKVIDITDARCNHEDFQEGLCCMDIFSAPDLFHRLCITYWITLRFRTEIWYSQNALEVYCL